MKNIKKLSLIIYCLFGILSISLAWRPSPRCDQSKQAFLGRSKRSTDTEASVPTETKLAAIIERQNNELLESYKNYTFVGIPVRGTNKKHSQFEINNSFDLFYYYHYSLRA